MSTVKAFVLALIVYQVILYFKGLSYRKAEQKVYLKHGKWKGKYLYVILLISLGIVSIVDLFVGLIGFILLVVNHSIHTKSKTKIRKEVFSRNAHKIFKFMLNQVSAGVRMSDALMKLYIVVNDKHLKECLIDLSAYYSQTSDLNTSLNILRRDYKGSEVDAFCVAVEHGIFMGSNYNTLKNLEELLFSKYIYQIKHETKLKKKRSLLSGIFLCSSIVLMIIVPIIIDMFRALEAVFN